MLALQLNDAECITVLHKFKSKCLQSNKIDPTIKFEECCECLTMF